MSQDRIDIVKRIYELAAEDWEHRRAGATDLPANEMTDLLSPDLVVQEVADFPDTDTYHGFEGLVRWWTGFLEVYDEVTFRTREFIPVGERVVVHVHQTLKSKTGVELELDMHHVWTFRDGRVVHLTGYRDRSTALEAAGSDP